MSEKTMPVFVFFTRDMEASQQPGGGHNHVVARGGEFTMARHNDNELRRMYKESVTLPHDLEHLSAWAEVVQTVEQMEDDNPDLRDHGFMSERLTDLFMSQLAKRGKRAVYDREGYRERITKIVLVFEKPLVAAEVLGSMLENLDDPTEGLEDAVRMAELTMGAQFVKLTQQEAEEEEFQSLMKHSAALGNHFDEPFVRKALAQSLQEADELQSTGIKGRELIEYVITTFIQNVRDRGLPARDEDWYRDTIVFIMRLYNKPHLGAVTLVKIAQKYPEPTETLAEIRAYASRSFEA
jgi:hypothetical protein